MKLPNANEPRWYRKALQTLLEMGRSALLSSFSKEKYHIQTELARMNYVRAIRNAFIQNIPKK
jgi:hypothetical protein